MLPLPPAGGPAMSGQETASHTFTVFTPTFNRRATLEAAYRSLAAQTFRDFEWLVVDDGSTDDTQDFVASLSVEADFRVVYHYQANAGKHVALNRAAELAAGRLFATLDSDDEYVPTALERFLHHWDSIPDRDGFAGVVALCADRRGDVIGTPFPADVLDSDFLEIRSRYGVTGDKAGFTTTASVREFPFPEFPGERFVTEALVYNRVARRYRVRCVNEVLMIKEYRPGGISARGRAVLARSARSTRLYHAEALELDALPARERFRHRANHVRFSLHAGLPARPPATRTLAYAAAYPLGFALYARDRIRS
jgi:glycosyltransferase involved in cell wall biosynthesis